MTLVRNYGKHQTLGNLILFGDYNMLWSCRTLELPWLDNLNEISCIPEGRYWVEKRISAAHEEHLHILDVSGRTWILIHAGNYYTQIRGCVLVGKEHRDINGDRLKDVNYSKITLGTLLSKIPERLPLTITSPYGELSY